MRCLRSCLENLTAKLNTREQAGFVPRLVFTRRPCAHIVLTTCHYGRVSACNRILNVVYAGGSVSNEFLESVFYCVCFQPEQSHESSHMDLRGLFQTFPSHGLNKTVAQSSIVQRDFQTVSQRLRIFPARPMTPLIRQSRVKLFCVYATCIKRSRASQTSSE